MIEGTPLELCGWMALFEGLRIINERDPGFQKQVRDSAATALMHFVCYRRDTLVQEWFPQFVGTTDDPEEIPFDDSACLQASEFASD